MTNELDILTPEEVGELLKLKTETVRQLMRKGLLPAFKIGGSWRSIRKAVYEYLENKMGLESGISLSRGEDNSQGVLQIQRRSKKLDQRRKGKSEEPAEIFFSR